LFEKQIKNKVDLAAMDYYMRLTTLMVLQRKIKMSANFSEKKAAAYLFKLKTNDRVGSIMSCHNVLTRV
jgi:hypothetical protein